MVISVGNLTVGGTGKTTCVELMAKKFIACRKQVAVLSRGYGGGGREYVLAWGSGGLLINGTAQAPTELLADEPQVLAQRLGGVPVLVGPDRVKSGRRAISQFGAEVIVLDDGFQHRRLARDCDIVLVRTRMPFGGWQVFPRGPMRENISALRRADIIVITKADEALESVGALTEHLHALAPSATIVATAHEPIGLEDVTTRQPYQLSRLDGARVGLLSSIGDPEGFEATVKQLHATIAWHRTFPDHYRYRLADWKALARPSSGVRPDAIVTTEKDWVRLRPLVAAGGSSSVPLWVLRVHMKVLSGEHELDDRLARVPCG